MRHEWVYSDLQVSEALLHYRGFNCCIGNSYSRDPVLNVQKKHCTVTSFGSPLPFRMVQEPPGWLQPMLFVHFGINRRSWWFPQRDELHHAMKGAALISDEWFKCQVTSSLSPHQSVICFLSNIISVTSTGLHATVFFHFSVLRF